MNETSADVVIVGSGAGGGVAAQGLAPLVRSGARVLVLEWGPRIASADCTGRELEMASKLYVDGGALFNRDRTVAFSCGRAYGGSTFVYTGTSLGLPEKNLRRWGVAGLDHEDLRRRTERHLADNNVGLLPEDRLNRNNRLFRDACLRLGFSAYQFPVNLKDCDGCGLCNLGCSSGAKQGTHRVQLPRAEAAGVEVVTECRVERVEDGLVTAVVSGRGSSWAPGRWRIRAKAVVAAAGALHTPALLLRSGLGSELPALGRWLTAHPAAIIVGRHAEPVGTRGHPKSFCCDEFEERGRFLLETCMYFPFVTAKNMAGFGVEHAESLRDLERLQMILALAIDDAEPENRISIDGRGEPVIDYRLSSRSLESLRGASIASARILFESGAERVHVPAGPPFSVTREEWLRRGEAAIGPRVLPGTASIACAHPMGGCRMGAGPADSVTDAWGRVHGLPWLYVADASLFPAAAGINPYPTVMALADRVAERVRSSFEAAVL